MTSSQGLGATDLRQRYPTACELIEKIIQCPHDVFEKHRDFWVANNMIFEDWVAAFHVDCPEACMRLNHMAGHGCTKEERCRFEHTCLICLKKGHGAFERKPNKRYKCALHDKFETEMEELQDRYQYEYDDIYGILQEAQPFQTQILSPAEPPPSRPKPKPKSSFTPAPLPPTNAWSKSSPKVAGTAPSQLHATRSAESVKPLANEHEAAPIDVPRVEVSGHVASDAETATVSKRSQGLNLGQKWGNAVWEDDLESNSQRPGPGSSISIKQHGSAYIKQSGDQHKDDAYGNTGVQDSLPNDSGATSSAEFLQSGMLNSAPGGPIGGSVNGLQPADQTREVWGMSRDWDSQQQQAQFHPQGQFQTQHAQLNQQHQQHMQLSQQAQSQSQSLQDQSQVALPSSLQVQQPQQHKDHLQNSTAPSEATAGFMQVSTLGNYGGVWGSSSVGEQISHPSPTVWGVGSDGMDLQSSATESAAVPFDSFIDIANNIWNESAMESAGMPTQNDGTNQVEIDPDASSTDNKPPAPFRARLECPVCFEAFNYEGERSPLLLSCGHSLCNSCAPNLFLDGDGANNRKHIRCPTCRAVHSVEGDGTESLTKNFALCDFLEQCKHMVGSHADLTSTSPDRQGTIHTDGVTPMCPEHRAYPLDLVCKEDSCIPTVGQPRRQMACVMCVQYGKHKGHRHDLVSSVASQVRHQMDELMSSANAAVDVLTVGSNAIEEVVSSIGGESSAVKVSDNDAIGTAGEAVRSIECARDAAIAAIKAQSEAMVGDVYRLRDAKLAALVSQQADVNGGLTKLHGAITDAENLSRAGAFELIQAKETILGGLNRAISVERPPGEVVPVCTATISVELTPLSSFTLGRVSNT